MAGLGYTPYGGASPQYRSGIRLKRDRAFGEFLTTTGQVTPWLAKAQNNLQFSGPLGCGRVDVTLTQAQINGSFATPVILIPAQTGVTIVLEGPIFFRYTSTGTAYVGPGNALLQYHIGALAASVTLPVTTMGTTSTENIVNALPNSTTNVVPTIGDQIEFTTSAAFTAGGGTLRVTFTYLYF